MSDFEGKDAEDIIQDVMLKIFENVESGLNIENIGAYIYRALSNKIIDDYRTQKNNLSLDEKNWSENELSLNEILSDARYETYSEVEKNRIKERIFEAVEKLSPDQREILIATELEGLTFKELSEKWNEPIGTLLSRKHRANSFLEKELSDLKD